MSLLNMILFSDWSFADGYSQVDRIEIVALLNISFVVFNNNIACRTRNCLIIWNVKEQNPRYLKQLY